MSTLRVPDGCRAKLHDMTLARRYTLAVATMLVVVWTVALNWEWSFIDDAGLKSAVNDYTDRLGPGGLWTLFTTLQENDRSWGLFRPAYHAFTTLFYLTNPAIAHGIRLAMLLAVLLIPAVRIGRDTVTTLLAFAVLAANVTLYMGLSYLSLQELSGLTFVAIGLLSEAPRRRSVLWLVAALFKTPFIWLFLAWSVYLLFQRKRWAWLNIVIGVTTVWLAASASRNGTYTQGISSANLPAGIKSAIPLFFWPGVVGLASVIALRPRWRTLRWRDPMVWVLLVGGALYLGNLLPWGHADSYYGAPPIWLMSVGVMRLVWPAERGTYRFARPVTVCTTLAALVGGTYVCQKMTLQQIHRNAAVVGARDFVASLPASATVALNGPEPAERLAQIMNFHGAPRAIGFVSDQNTTDTPTYYIYFHDQSNGNPRLRGKVVKGMAMATIYATGSR